MMTLIITNMLMLLMMRMVIISSVRLTAHINRLN